MHSFNITKNYFIVIEEPLPLSVTKIAKIKMLNDPLALTLKWCPNECTLFHVANRANSKSKFTYNASTFLFLHVIGSYEIVDYIESNDYTHILQNLRFKILL